MSPSSDGRRALDRRASSRLRPLGLPRGLHVRVDEDGMPAAVTRTDARGQRGRETAVQHVQEVWRIAEEWWRSAPQARTYFRVILDGGHPLTLYRDDVSGTWAEQHYGGG